MSEDYDEIDYLIDNDTIRLGERCRAAEAKLTELQEALGAAVEAANAERRAGERLADRVAELEEQLAEDEGSRW